jgi:mRNA interferase RelE/StbE
VAWKIKFEKSAHKAFAKFNKQFQIKILKYICKYIIGSNDPRMIGKALRGVFGGLWRYRVGDYRLICQIKDNELVVLVVIFGHRKDIYKKQKE